MTTLALPAVGSFLVKTSIALSTDHLIAIVFHCEHLERRLDHTTRQTECEMDCRIFPDVIIRDQVAILQLFIGKDKSLLTSFYSFSILDLILQVCDRVCVAHIKGDGLAVQ